jgi:hypothetical protein
MTGGKMQAAQTKNSSDRQTEVDTFRGSDPVLKAPTEKAFVFDKDGTIKNNTIDPNPTDSELTARKEIRSISSNYVEITSTAQSPEMGMSSDVYRKSLASDFNRLPVNWVKGEDGRYSYKDLEKLREFDHLLNFGGTNNFGYGVGVLNNGRYRFDAGYDYLLGGPEWKPRIAEGLSKLDKKYPELELPRRLAPYENPSNYFITKTANVEPLPYRTETNWDSLELKERFGKVLFKAQLEGEFPADAKLVDESNLRKNRHTYYVVPKYAQKHRSIGRLFSQICDHARVLRERFEVFAAGDTRTDVDTILRGMQGVKRAIGVLAAGSEVAESMELNKLDFVGVPLGWDRKHDSLTPRYKKVAPGVYTYRAHRLLTERTIVFAEYAEFSRGLKGAESVLACMHHFGFKR